MRPKMVGTCCFSGEIQYDVVGGVPQFPDTPAPNFWNHPYGFVGGHTWVLSNNLINNFRYGLTREAFTNQGDSAENSISFRFVYSPRRFLRTLSRVTPTHNFTDDLSWIKGNHNYQFGTNIRIIRNRRNTFATPLISAVTIASYSTNQEQFWTHRSRISRDRFPGAECHFCDSWTLLPILRELQFRAQRRYTSVGEAVAKVRHRRV